MSYGTNKHNVWTQRAKNLATAFQNLREESARLDAIYVNEAASGADAAFVSNGTATKAEMQDLVTSMRAYKEFWENGAVIASDRQQHLTPFLAND